MLTILKAGKEERVVPFDVTKRGAALTASKTVYKPDGVHNQVMFDKASGFAAVSRFIKPEAAPLEAGYESPSPRNY